MDKYYKKEIEIKRKMFSKGDIEQLAKVLYSESKLESSSFEFKIFFEDGKFVSSGTPDFFAWDILDRKQTTKIKMTYGCKRSSNSIQINIHRSREFVLEQNHISIKSDSQVWLRSVEQKFQGIIDVIPLQKKPLSNPIFLLICLSPILVANAFSSIAKCIGIPQFIQLAILIMIIIVYLYTYLKVAFWNLRRLYPNVDFAFGPRHLSSSARKENIKWVVGVILSMAGIMLPIVTVLF